MNPAVERGGAPRPPARRVRWEVEEAAEPSAGTRRWIASGHLVAGLALGGLALVGIVGGIVAIEIGSG